FQRRLDGVAHRAARRGVDGVAFVESRVYRLLEGRQIGLRHRNAPLRAVKGVAIGLQQTRRPLQPARKLCQARMGVNHGTRRFGAVTGRDRTRMNPEEKSGWTPLPHSDEDLERAKAVPDTPQTRAPAYRLAWDDEDFMTRRELRAVRLQLELLKPEMMLAERGIRSTVVLFGGARIPEPGGDAWAAKNETQKKNL